MVLSSVIQLSLEWESGAGYLGYVMTRQKLRIPTSIELFWLTISISWSTVEEHMLLLSLNNASLSLNSASVSLLRMSILKD